MKILIFWDVYGRIWRKALAENIEKLQQKYTPDFTIANIENCTSWRWPVADHASYISQLWVDVMTTGDHAFDNIEKIQDYFKKADSTLIRPANFYEHADYHIPGKGYYICEKNGKRLAVIQLLGQVFMKHAVDSPFSNLQSILSMQEVQNTDGIVVDFHRETTAEIYALAHFFDGKISCVYGTHTHVQTNDAQILDKGTSMISDVGMTWPAYSIIGADPLSVKKRFFTGIQKWKIEQSLRKDAVISALFVELDTNKKTKNIENILLRK